MSNIPTHRMDFEGRLVPLTPDEVAAWENEQQARPAPPDTVAPPARVAAKAYVRAALSRLGALHIVDAAVSTLPDEQRILWEDANDIAENDRPVVELARALNLDLVQVFDTAEVIRREVRPGA